MTGLDRTRAALAALAELVDQHPELVDVELGDWETEGMPLAGHLEELRDWLAWKLEAPQ